MKISLKRPLQFIASALTKRRASVAGDGSEGAGPHAAGNIGRVDAQRRTEQALSESEARFRALFTHLPHGFAIHQVICDDAGRVVDCLYLDVNPGFEKITGLSRAQLVGHRLTEVIPDVERYWLESLGQVALTGMPQYFENFSSHSDKWLATHSYRPAPGQFATVVEDITARKQAEKKIELLAYRDPLTGLPNRHLMRDRFEHACTQARRTQTKIAVLLLDLDSFKNINDSLGHPVGDSLLRIVAERLRDCVRSSDTIGRLGGDEFLAIVPDMQETDAAGPVLLKIAECLQMPFDLAGHELSTSVSIGVAVYPDDGDNFDLLLKKADTAMYRAKESGRNTALFFDERMNTQTVEHLAIRTGLRKALERGEFELHYQPQIDLASEAVIGAEALIRWRHPETGMIPPGRFIHIAEESGLIVQIGAWVIREACRQAAIWNAGDHPDLPIAVNLSAVQFKRGDVEQIVSSALREADLAPHLLELELTESILIQNADNVVDTVKRLKSSGVMLSIDDFGTGYSSLSYLKRLHVDKLKIDQSFIRDLASDPKNAAIVQAIVQMAQSFNLRTIAEGVETQDILDQLRHFDCGEAQGYHFARPMPAEEFARYLARQRASQAGGTLH